MLALVGSAAMAASRPEFKSPSFRDAGPIGVQLAGFSGIEAEGSARSSKASSSGRKSTRLVCFREVLGEIWECKGFDRRLEVNNTILDSFRSQREGVGEVARTNPESVWVGCG